MCLIIFSRGTSCELVLPSKQGLFYRFSASFNNFFTSKIDTRDHWLKFEIE